MNKGGNPE